MFHLKVSTDEDDDESQTGFDYHGRVHSGGNLPKANKNYQKMGSSSDDVRTLNIQCWCMIVHFPPSFKTSLT